MNIRYDSEKYDRQVRLWGQKGQQKFQSSKVCLVNCGPLGIEVLRGLCLAGIGSFTMLDSRKLTAEEVGCSYLPHLDSVGKLRTTVATAMLNQINRNAKGDAQTLEVILPNISYIPPYPNSINTNTTINRNYYKDIPKNPRETSTKLAEVLTPRQLDLELETDSNFWKQFDCVIVAGVLFVDQIQRISKVCWLLNVPLIVCKSLGFYGYIRTQINQHTVEDTHPEWLPKDHDPNKPETAVITGGKPIYEEYVTKYSSKLGDNEEDDYVNIYSCMIALDLFFATFNRLPGPCQHGPFQYGEPERDTILFSECVMKLFDKKNQTSSIFQHIDELTRVGGAELHTISAFIGGCVAQEAIKIMTNQYIPLEDTLVYNAMSGTTRSFKIDEFES